MSYSSKFMAVLAAFGQTLESVQRLSDFPEIGGGILARGPGSQFLVGVGYPDQDEDGYEVYREIALVDLK